MKDLQYFSHIITRADITKKERVNENVIKLDASNNDNGDYKIKTI